MGRPPLKMEHKRDERVVFHVTKSEIAKIRFNFEQSGMATLSDYIRAQLGLNN